MLWEHTFTSDMNLTKVGSRHLSFVGGSMLFPPCEETVGACGRVYVLPKGRCPHSPVFKAALVGIDKANHMQ